MNPNDPTHPIVKMEVKPFRVNDYRRIFGCSTEKQIRNLKVIGAASAVVVHDPTLENDVLLSPVRGPVPFVEKEPVPFIATEVTKIADDETKITEAIASERAHVEKKVIKRTRKPVKR